MSGKGKLTKRISILLVFVTAVYMLCGGIQAEPAFAASKLGAPSYLVEKYGSTEIKVTIKKLRGADGYKVYRATKKNGKYKAVKTFGKAKGSFIDKKLKASTKYYYKVKAYKKVGSKKKYGRFSAIKYAKTKATPQGNAAKYGLSNSRLDFQKSDLEGKRAYFLGSSVTKGMYTKSDGTGDLSFVEMLEKKYGMKVRKSAVNGTTLVTPTADNYVSRLIKDLGGLDAPDYFVCQLSTNDATKGSPLGSITPGKYRTSELNDKTDTVTGALEYITAYAQTKWSCPVIFYIPTKPKSKWTHQDRYLKMIDALYKVQAKWNAEYQDQVQIIDLWNNPKAKYTSTDDRLLCMFNTLHPTKAGYLLKYVPIIGDFLLNKYIETRNKTAEPEQPADVTPTDGEPTDGVPTDTVPTDGTPADEAPGDEVPAGDAA